MIRSNGSASQGTLHYEPARSQRADAAATAEPEIRLIGLEEKMRFLRSIRPASDAIGRDIRGSTYAEGLERQCYDLQNVNMHLHSKVETLEAELGKLHQQLADLQMR